MYRVEFYETEDGDSQIWDFLEDLRLKAAVSKDARIQHKQASLYIELGKLYSNISKEKELECYQKGVLMYKDLEII